MVKFRKFLYWIEPNRAMVSFLFRLQFFRRPISVPTELAGLSLLPLFPHREYFGTQQWSLCFGEVKDLYDFLNTVIIFQFVSNKKSDMRLDRHMIIIFPTNLLHGSLNINRLCWVKHSTSGEKWLFLPLSYPTYLTPSIISVKNTVFCLIMSFYNFEIISTFKFICHNLYEIAVWVWFFFCRVFCFPSFFPSFQLSFFILSFVLSFFPISL